MHETDQGAALLAEDLDRDLAQNGCAACASRGVIHAAHGPMYLNARCHPRATRVRIQPTGSDSLPTITISCFACGLLIVAVAVRERLGAALEKSGCPCEAGLQARYTVGSGILEVCCRKCKIVLHRLLLQRRWGQQGASA